jgi:hypothetical protein
VEEEQHRRDEARWLERERALAAAAAQKEDAAMRADRERARNRELHHKVGCSCLSQGVFVVSLVVRVEKDVHQSVYWFVWSHYSETSPA